MFFASFKYIGVKIRKLTIKFGDLAKSNEGILKILHYNLKQKFICSMKTF